MADLAHVTVKVWDGDSDSTPQEIQPGDTFGGLFFPAGEYAVSDRLHLKGGSLSNPVKYTGIAATFNSDGSVASAGSVIKDTSTTDHYAFGIGFAGGPSSYSYMTIQKLTFDGCGIASLDAPVDNLLITNTFAHNSVADSGSNPEYHAIIHENHGLADSDITDNVFRDNMVDTCILLDQNAGAQANSVSVSENTFANCNHGIHILLHGSAAGQNHDVTVDDNVGVNIADKLIEVQGDTSSNLEVNSNKVSGFGFRDDSTFALSVVVNGPNVLDTEVAYNEISATRTPDGHSGNTSTDAGPRTSVEVQIGIEVAGRTGHADHVALVHDNIIQGVWAPIVMETSDNMSIYDNHIWD
jgi:hypothetical protein